MADHDTQDDDPEADEGTGKQAGASWSETRDQNPVNERDAAAYQRLMEAEARLYEWWEQRHPATTHITELLASPSEDTNHLWLAALGEKVAAMGGHLKLTAVFGNETLTLLREPGPGNPEPAA